MPRPLLFNIDKPVGISSHDVVRHFKKHLGTSLLGKIGHLGTLDPFAQGLLLVASGGAQRLNDLIHQWYPKTYLAKGVLGVQTPTGDMTVPPCFKDQSERFAQLQNLPLSSLQQAWDSFCGPYWQAPHRFSASKFQGKPLHYWSRKGIPILKDPVKREIKELVVKKWDFPMVSFLTTVSSGTYIRSLFEDMAKKLHTFGTLTNLQRVAIGPFHISQALPQNQWPHSASLSPKDLEENRWAQKYLLHHQLPLPQVSLNPEETKYYSHGRKLTRPDPMPSGPCWVLDPRGELLGLAQSEKKQLTPQINFQSS